MITDLPDIWRRTSSLLNEEVDAIVLVAFRLLFYRLEDDGFFPGSPGLIDTVRGEAPVPRELKTLMRNGESGDVQTFVRLVEDRLISRDTRAVASLAFAIDRVYGPYLSESLKDGDPGRQRIVAEAVNAANRALRLEGLHAIVLVRLQRYWSKYENYAPEIPPQDFPSEFLHFVPLTTKLSRVDYSRIHGSDPRMIVVALWPVEGPKFGDPELNVSPPVSGMSKFRFKPWKDLPTGNQAQHQSFANRIAKYVTSADDARGLIYVVAAPELMLAPEVHRTINEAVATRRNAAWIVFPGSYHFELGKHVVNLAVMHVGGVINKNDLFVDHACGAVAAVKGIPFVERYQGLEYVEDIDRTASSIHVLDSPIGRIAVMICRDFLEGRLTEEVLSMGIDHLFVLSMSPDSGFKFETAMEGASNRLTGTFVVNAFTKRDSKFFDAGYRKPLKDERVVRKPPTSDEPFCVVVLKPDQ
ncbi:MAG: hypothetical protein HY847_06555 [Betaproteobacteria bacterium]|nr:hypothetical protein [Betaproteobacteria bacterium]